MLGEKQPSMAWMLVTPLAATWAAAAWYARIRTSSVREFKTLARATQLASPEMLPRRFLRSRLESSQRLRED